MGAGGYTRSRWVPRICTTVASVGHMTNCPRTQNNVVKTQRYTHVPTGSINMHAGVDAATPAARTPSCKCITVGPSG